MSALQLGVGRGGGRGGGGASYGLKMGQKEEGAMRRGIRKNKYASLRSAPKDGDLFV
jgi:hypothetical protein